jgi:hypothetical protein
MSDETLKEQIKILLEKRELRLISLDQFLESIIAMVKK